MPGQCKRAGHFRAQYAFERIQRFVSHQLVFDNAGAVNDTIDAAEALVEICEQSCECAAVGAGSSGIFDCRARLLHGGDVRPDLARTADFRVLTLSGSRREYLPRTARTFD